MFTKKIQNVNLNSENKKIGILWPFIKYMMIPYKMMVEYNIFICSQILSFTGKRRAVKALGKRSYKKWVRKHKANVINVLI